MFCKNPSHDFICFKNIFFSTILKINLVMIRNTTTIATSEFLTAFHTYKRPCNALRILIKFLQSVLKILFSFTTKSKRKFVFTLKIHFPSPPMNEERKKRRNIRPDDPIATRFSLKKIENKNSRERWYKTANLKQIYIIIRLSIKQCMCEVE